MKKSVFCKNIYLSSAEIAQKVVKDKKEFGEMRRCPNIQG